MRFKVRGYIEGDRAPHGRPGYVTGDWQRGASFMRARMFSEERGQSAELYVDSRGLAELRVGPRPGEGGEWLSVWKGEL